MGEKFAANPVTGTGSMTVPIATSPGRSGFGPQLALSYDSGAGNGAFGFGWSLSLPQITRKTDKGLPRYDDTQESDVFILSGAEDLVPLLNSSGSRYQDATTAPGFIIHRYRPRIEGLFARIERWTRQSDGDIHWRSISRDNILTLYGKDGNARIADPADATRIFTWLICETRDDKGNAVLYEFKPEDGTGVDLAQAHERNRGNRDDPRRAINRYLKRIRYGNRVPLLDGTGKRPRFLPSPPVPDNRWMFEVVLDYDDHNLAAPKPRDDEEKDATGALKYPWKRRQDPFSTYRAGFEVRTTRLCQRVLMFHHFPGEPDVGTDCLVRSTDFTYSHEQDPASARNPVYTFVRAVTQTGYKRQGTGYLQRSLPPVEFDYTQPIVQDTVQEVDAQSLENLPIGVDGAAYQWTDLHGEGIPGILTEQAGTWFYKRNLSPINLVGTNGDRHLEPLFSLPEVVASKPNLALAGGAQFMDLAGDGQPDLVVMDGLMPGLYEHDEEESWQPFRPFTSRLNRDMRDPNLRFVDLDGDGHADVLITEDDALVWHPSLAEAGFGPARRVHLPLDEEHGPRLVFADVTQSVYLADLSGDGLTDLVRIRNGEVCYWPNLGYGRFGAKVTMDGAPWFDHPAQFDHKRLRLADIDGTGTTDLIYLHLDDVRLYFNQSGNSWSAPQALRVFPRVDNLVSIAPTDLLGNGTACLVWSSSLPGDARRQMRYVDLMGGQKPHLLMAIKNNLGAETRIQYASSTKFYLLDRQAGQPWATRLPFPVHVVERVESLDRISRSRFTGRYVYHHGCFDGEEREVRGFGMVEQHDSEELSALAATDIDFTAANLDSASHVPPVVTKTWFHPGIWEPGGKVSHLFAHDYWRPAGLTEAQAEALLLPDTILPAGLTLEEEREACRSLKGGVLRQEIYAQDGTTVADLPYSVSERNYTIQLVQARGWNAHAVFFTHARETIDYHYERQADDPRVSHSLVLELDPFGNVLRSANIGYGRQNADPALAVADQAEQAKTHATAGENRFTNFIDTADAYRAPLPCETRTLELTAPLVNGPKRISFDDVRGVAATAVEIPYEATANPLAERKRCIEHVRTFYRKDDLTGMLALGLVESLALPFEAYKLAFTPALITRIFGTKVTDPMLSGEGHYVHSEGDTNWWIPSGRVFFSVNPGDTPAQELLAARTHFFLPRRFHGPFGEETLVSYDAHDLLTVEIEDSLKNRTTSGERNLLTGVLLANGNDYRVLQPALVTDANGNRIAAAFDALGWVAGTALMGKRNQTAPSGRPLGDTLAGFEPELTDAQIDAFFTQPRWQAGSPAAPVPTFLAGATSRVIYDPRRFHRFGGNPGHPACAAMLVRERHVSDLGPGEETAIQSSVSYSDGFGREIQKKVQAEPGPVLDGGPDVQPRWVGSGWTIFNNKGLPVRQFEPFFTATVDFEFNRQHGVSPVIFYDSVGRSVATLSPDHSYAKVILHPWRQYAWDGNDTSLLDPRVDPDVRGFAAGFFAGLPPGWQTWHGTRAAGALGPEEQTAASKAAAHAATPTAAHFDSLGRAFLTITDRGGGVVHASHAELDLEGNERSVTDARGRIVMRYDYDILGRRMRQDSMEAGTRWTLLAVDSQPIRAWDSRGFSRQMAYDALRRPTGLFVTDPGAPGPIQAERTIYGESLANPHTTNHRGKPHQVFDGAGVVTSVAFDFKGNLLQASRRLVSDYKQRPNWDSAAPAPALEPEIYTTSTTNDALNRAITSTTPDGTVTRRIFNEANLLDRLTARLPGDASDTVFIANLDYNSRGQRQRLELGNGVVTTCTYDPVTFRLRRLFTRRPVHPDPFRQVLQDIHYFHDPAGNITRSRDDAQQPIFYANAVAPPHQDFTYDALYRLIEATGREHIGQAGSPVVPDWDDPFRTGLIHPHDGSAMRPYTERYEYDEVGNFDRMVHVAANGNWTREYSYQSTSQLEPGKFNNRLTGTEVVSPGVTYTHDVHGNMITMPHLSQLIWDFKDQLTNVTLGAGEQAYYQYSASGERIRKVRERANGTRLEERRYLGGSEVYRRYDGTGFGVTLERDTLHVFASAIRIALVENRTRGLEPGVPLRLTRYQIGNHLGSVAIEVEGSSASEVISHEEFYPYGAASFRAARNGVEAPNRYRYTGKERDEESGLSYHGARYYTPWLGRWTNCDPAGLVDGPSLYVYVRCNPVMLVDPFGMQGMPQAKYEQFKSWLHQAADKIKPLEKAVEQVESKVKETTSDVAETVKTGAKNMMIDLVTRTFWAQAVYNSKDQKAIAAYEEWGRKKDLEFVAGTLQAVTMTKTANAPSSKDKTVGSPSEAALVGRFALTIGPLLGGGGRTPFTMQAATDLKLSLAGESGIADAALLSSAPADAALTTKSIGVTEAESLAPLNAEQLGGTRVWLVGPEGASSTRALRFNENRITYDTRAPAGQGMVRADMKAVRNNLGLSEGSAPAGEWVTGTHGNPEGAFGGALAEPKFFNQERGYGGFYGFRVTDATKPGFVFPQGQPAVPTVYSWCYSSATCLRTP